MLYFKVLVPLLEIVIVLLYIKVPPLTKIVSPTFTLVIAEAKEKRGCEIVAGLTSFPSGATKIFWEKTTDDADKKNSKKSKIGKKYFLISNTSGCNYKFKSDFITGNSNTLINIIYLD
jgi:hypothetical protein